MAGWAKSLKWLTVGLGFMAASIVATAQEQLTEGKEFLRLKAPQTSGNADVVKIGKARKRPPCNATMNALPRVIEKLRH